MFWNMFGTGLGHHIAGHLRDISGAILEHAWDTGGTRVGTWWEKVSE